MIYHIPANHTEKHTITIYTYNLQNLFREFYIDKYNNIIDKFYYQTAFRSFDLTKNL